MRYKTVHPRCMSVGDWAKVCVIHLFLSAGSSEEKIICDWYKAHGSILLMEKVKTVFMEKLGTMVLGEKRIVFERKWDKQEMRYLYIAMF